MEQLSPRNLRHLGDEPNLNDDSSVEQERNIPMRLRIPSINDDMHLAFGIIAPEDDPRRRRAEFNRILMVEERKDDDRNARQGAVGDEDVALPEVENLLV